MNEGFILQVSTYTPTKISVDWTAACLRFEISRHASISFQLHVLQKHPYCHVLSKRRSLHRDTFMSDIRPLYLDDVISLR